MSGGTLDMTVLTKSSDPAVRDWAQQVIKHDERVSAKISPEGELGLPRKLDLVRLKYRIPDGAFRLQAVFDRIYVYQVPWDNKETFGDSPIIKPDTVKHKETVQAPLGVIISAGLKAMDILRSNGLDLGHTVGLIRLAPYRIECDTIGGKTIEILVMNSGDLVGGEELAKQLRAREARIVFDEELQQHIYVDSNGKRWVPIAADQSFDY